MSDKKQLTLMSQFSIIRESPARILHNQQKSKQQQPKQQSASSELKFKIEPIGIQPEDDDDLETCPSRTRSAWPHQIIPWWKPADRFEKPPYSYATLIAHAILTSKDGRLTLSDIYKWISEAYPYYKRGQKGWQNSIRHNLSLNKKWFIKVDRRPTQAHPGKGGYWTLQMNMEKIFVDNLSQAGGHSRRHHDMGMYASLSTQYYRSESSSSLSNDDDRQDYVDEKITQMCPNIHITRPEDYQVTASTGKKPKPNGPSNVISAPRIRNMTTQEKSVAAAMSSNEPIEVITPPKTDPKNFIIRFNPMDDSVNNKRKLSRPAPKSGKKRNHVELESSTAEEHGQGNGVGVDPYTDSPSKKRKSTTTTDTIITASPNAYTSSYPVVVQNSTTRPSDLIDSMPTADYGFNNNDFWMYDEDATAATTNAMLLTSEYPLLFDVDAQNILNGLTSAAPAASTTQHTDMKTINLQLNALENNIHYSNTFNSEEFSDPNSSLFISDLTSYHLEQYVDFGATGSVLLDNQKPPSDVLLEQDESMNTYWPSSNDACYMNYVSDSSSMPSC